MLPALVLAAALVSACGEQSAPAPDQQLSSELRQAMQKHTETLLLIHYRLDSAATELADAEALSEAGNHSGADFHVSEARRHLDAADDAVLELGQKLQQQFNLDASGAR
jgi:hypothetical protein